MAELTYSIFNKKRNFSKPQTLLKNLNLQIEDSACLFALLSALNQLGG